jgi:hypothetical protein
MYRNTPTPRAQLGTNWGRARGQRHTRSVSGDPLSERPANHPSPQLDVNLRAPLFSIVSVVRNLVEFKAAKPVRDIFKE